MEGVGWEGDRVGVGVGWEWIGWEGVVWEGGRVGGSGGRGSGGRGSVVGGLKCKVLCL